MRWVLLLAGFAALLLAGAALAQAGHGEVVAKAPATLAGVLIGLLTLTALEIVLGVDNVVFIAIIAGRLPPPEQRKGRQWGLVISIIPRVVMLLGIGIVIASSRFPLFHLPFIPAGITPKDLVLIGGGLFLLWKSTKEIHHKLEGEDQHVGATTGAATFRAVMVQMLMVNVVFSFDSVITAVGMVEQVWVMIAAVLISSGFMLLFAEPVGRFVEAHPTVKMLALAFLILIGANLVAEGLHQHIPRGYTYFAMAFSTGVEMLNLRLRGRGAKPVQLHHPIP